MADENKPAFYPRVGNIKAKNFKSAQPMPFVEDPRAMDLPQYGDIDLSVPTKENLEMGRRMAERDAQLRRQQQADRSPLEKLAGGVQAGRLMGSALAQSVASIPTALREGSKAADEYIAENMYKPTQPLAYEYAQDVGDFLEKLETEYKIPPILPEAMALQFLTGPGTSQAARAAGRGTERAGRAIESRMEPIVRGALEQGGLPREMVMAMGANTQSNVIKPKGGNWIGGDVEQALDPLITKGIISNREIPYGPEFDSAIIKRIADLKETASAPNYKGGAGRVASMLEEDLQDAVSTQNRVKNAAINKWVQSNLTNYIKKDMGTPDDPVRKLAEQDISHLPQDLQNIEMTWTPEELAKTRKRFGFPEEETATNPTAKMWEQMADEMIAPSRATEFGEKARQQNPWLEKLNPYDTVYETMRGMPQALKFDHIVDVLREDLTTGRIRPEQLNKVSMEQAVRRTYEYDQEMAKRMAETAIKEQTGFPVLKEYPEGYKWLDLSLPSEQMMPEGYNIVRNPDVITPKDGEPYMLLNPQGEAIAFGNSPGDIMRGISPDMRPGYGKLKKALDYEGNVMGHCVGSYCDKVSGGNTKIYSLRDKKGEPHVTIEVEQDTTPPRVDQIKRYMAAAEEEAKQLPQGYTNRDITDIATRMAMDNAPPTIVQIKGKQNRAPKDEYLPFVQDFVRSRDWNEINDLYNTGLQGLDDAFPDYEMVKAFSRANPDKKFVNQKEIDDFTKEWKSLGGMKAGGKVSISKNPDTMMLEVNNQKMKNGVPAYGAGKLVTSQAVKSNKVPPPIKFPVTRGPSIPEIRAMAERMAPQVMGEFVRAAPTPSNPKPSTSVVGKTQKQFEREKTLPIEYQNIKDPVTPEEFDYAKKKGALLIGGAGDVTPGNRMLVSIDEQPLSTPVHLQAGPEWEMYNPSAWAASDQMAKTYMKRAGKAAEAYDADPYLHYHKMTPDANWYAMHHFNSILGHLRPEELKLRDPKLYQQMVEEIRTKDVGFGKHPDFEGFDDPLNLQIHAQIDPNFRRHIGAIFNGPTFTKRYGLNSGQDVLAATSLPELRDLEPGAGGYAIVPLDVKAPLRNFEADSQTYDTGFPKAGPSGRSKYPSPYQLIYRDTLNWMKENPSEKKSSEFGRMNMIVPKQQIDNELIEAIGEYQRRMKELTGKKKGGAVKKAEGGYLKKPAAYINGDEFVNAAKKYGIKDSMNNLNKIVDLVNKGLSVDDAARQVADSGMHKAAGGAISGDDLIIEERPL